MRLSSARSSLVTLVTLTRPVCTAEAPAPLQTRTRSRLPGRAALLNSRFSGARALERGRVIDAGLAHWPRCAHSPEIVGIHLLLVIAEHSVRVAMPVHMQLRCMAADISSVTRISMRRLSITKCGVAS